jgi:indole-3-glycerol phosphate synthase
MGNHLDQILAATRDTVKARKTACVLRDLERAAAAHHPRGFARALRQKAAGGFAVIAELKKASPSRGLIRPSFDVMELASSFAAAGAAALSVLTEEQFFQGSLKNLELASDASGLPCLRKDFLVDEFQLLEARASRADAVLLIAAALSDSELKDLAAKAHAISLDVLCEVHTEEELERILGLGLDCEAIGVNNRNLKSFEVRLDVSLKLAERIPLTAVRVAESGIETAADLITLRSAGFQAFLMGEALMRAPQPGEVLRGLLSQATSAATISSRN